MSVADKFAPSTHPDPSLCSASDKQKFQPAFLLIYGVNSTYLNKLHDKPLGLLAFLIQFQYVKNSRHYGTIQILQRWGTSADCLLPLLRNAAREGFTTKQGKQKTEDMFLNFISIQTEK